MLPAPPSLERRTDAKADRDRRSLPPLPARGARPDREEAAAAEAPCAEAAGESTAGRVDRRRDGPVERRRRGRHGPGSFVAQLGPGGEAVRPADRSRGVPPAGDGGGRPRAAEGQGGYGEADRVD